MNQNQKDNVIAIVSSSLLFCHKLAHDIKALEPTAKESKAAYELNPVVNNLTNAVVLGVDTILKGDSIGVQFIDTERQLQILKGWTEEHDEKEHPHGELLQRAGMYIDESGSCCSAKDKINSLGKAGALIAAEIDRLYRGTK